MFVKILRKDQSPTSWCTMISLWKKCPKNPSIYGISKVFFPIEVKNHVWDGIRVVETIPIPSLRHEWLIRMVNVGNYASPMDAMGYTNTSWVVDVLGESPHDLVSFATYTFGDFFVDFSRGSFALCRRFVVLEVEKSTAWLYGFICIFMQISEQHLLDIHWVPHLSATYHTGACLVHPGTFFQRVGLFLVGIYIPPKKVVFNHSEGKRTILMKCIWKAIWSPEFWKPSTH